MSVLLKIADSVTDKERRLALGRAIIRQVAAASSLKEASARCDLGAYRQARTALAKARDLTIAWEAVQLPESAA